jgi:hypothetical protein
MQGHYPVPNSNIAPSTRGSASQPTSPGSRSYYGSNHCGPDLNSSSTLGSHQQHERTYSSTENWTERYQAPTIMVSDYDGRSLSHGNSTAEHGSGTDVTKADLLPLSSFSDARREMTFSEMGGSFAWESRNRLGRRKSKYFTSDRKQEEKRRRALRDQTEELTTEEDRHRHLGSDSRQSNSGTVVSRRVQFLSDLFHGRAPPGESDV